MKTLKLKETPQLKGKTVGDKCGVYIMGTIKEIAKEPDYDDIPMVMGKEKKKPKEYIFYTLEYNPGGKDVKTKEYDDSIKGEVEKVVDNNPMDEEY